MEEQACRNHGGRRRSWVLVPVVTAALTLLLVTSLCMAGVCWIPNGVPVCTESHDQIYPEIATDEAGGAVITWEDDRAGWDNIDIYAQRIDASGNVMWKADGVPVCTAAEDQDRPRIASDGTGGAIISWQDYRSTTQWDVYAQRVDAGGNVKWANNGVALSKKDGHQDYPEITSDGSGGAIVTWADDDGYEFDIFTQKLDAGGNKQWGAVGTRISTNEPGPTGVHLQGFPEIAPDGSGGAVIAWQDNPPVSSGRYMDDTYAGGVDSNGNLKWMSLARTDNTWQADQQIAADGSGGAVVTWEDLGEEGDEDHDYVYAQRFGSNGIRKWGNSAVAVCTANDGSYSIYPMITTDGSGGAIITWHDWRTFDIDTSTSIYVQRVDAGGETRWTKNGVRASCPDKAPGRARIIPDGAGGAILCWDQLHSPAGYSVYAQKVDNDGNLMWTANGIPVTNDVGIDPHQSMTTDGSGGAIVAWQVVIGTDIYAQKVSDSGGATTWYLAEGSSAWGFVAEIHIENPNNQEATARVTYMTDSGPITIPDITLPAMSQTYINPWEDLGERDFSTRVECLEGLPIAVDRTMYWRGEGESIISGHCSIGVTSPARTWYLPEGSSDWGFECWLLIQNPNDTEATCQVTYMIEGEGPQTFEKKIPANSRKTYNMADDIGAADASIKVEADLPVIPERAMYRNNRWEGHDSIGTTTPATDFFLAEGTTAWGFTTYVLVQNPNPGDTEVTVTYMTSSGPVPQGSFNMPGNSRETICVNDVMPGSDFSTQVHGSQPIIAERAMYWGDTEGREACHDSIGVSSPHTTFYLPAGSSEVYLEYETWTLVQNPNDTAVEVEISYLTWGGANNITFTETIPANSRRTYSMEDRLPDRCASILVTSKTPGNPIIVERAMYWQSRGGGTDTIGGYSD